MPTNTMSLFAFHSTDSAECIINTENELIFTTCQCLRVELHLCNVLAQLAEICDSSTLVWYSCTSAARFAYSRC